MQCVFGWSVQLNSRSLNTEMYCLRYIGVMLIHHKGNCIVLYANSEYYILLYSNYIF